MRWNAEPFRAEVFIAGFGAGSRELIYCSKFALRPDSSVVERGPEKAGVGGSIPSLATTTLFFPLRQRPKNHLNPLFCYYLPSPAFALFH